jgi:DNA helicase-2/ATP-dependent DNA helicase PcrA
MAADEMRNRLQEDPIMSEHIDRVLVGTIHSFALDLVQNRGNLIGLSTDLTLFEDTSDRKRMIRDIIFRDVALKKVLERQDRPDKYLTQILSMIAEQKKKFINPELCNYDDVFKSLYQAYNDYLLEQNAMDFDDILFYAYRILTENPKVQKLYASLYKYIFVDEAQDLNFAQYEVIKAICGDSIKNIMFVGDANQSVYGFNGSDSKLMTEEFVKDFSPCVIELHDNYRSARKIVEFANKLENTGDVSNYVYDGELRAFEFYNEDEEASSILSSIQFFVNNGHPDIEGKVNFEDCAVIGRNRYTLSEVEKKLQNAGIPFYYKRTVNGIEPESNLLKIFDLTLRVFQNSNDIIHLQELCAMIGVPFSGHYGKDVIYNLLSEKMYLGIINSLKWMEDNVFDFDKGLIELENGIDSEKNSEEDSYLILHDIELWRKHWKKYISQVSRENRSLVSFRNYISLGKTQDISDEKGVALLTAHMSKGLQFEVVYVLGLNDGTFPDYRAINSGEKEMEQERNNMFVAVTRAKRICYLTYPNYKKMPWGDVKLQKKSRFLNDLIIEKEISCVK